MTKKSWGSFRETWDRYQQYQHFFPYLVLGLILLSTVSLLRSGWDRINRLQENNAREEERIALLSARVSQVESISTEEIEDRIRDAVFALPRIKDPLLTLSSAKALALESNLMIDEINFSPGEIRKDYSNSKKIPQLETTAINFSLQGFEDDILQFAQKAAKRSPLLSLTGMTLDFETAKGGIVLAKILANTFFAPVDTAGFSEKTEITLQAKEEALYQRVRALEKVGTSPIAEGAEFVVFDEERDPFTFSPTTTGATPLETEVQEP